MRAGGDQAAFSFRSCLCSYHHLFVSAFNMSSVTSPKPRQVAVALVVLSDGLHSSPQFLVVSSRKHKVPELKWVLPKGGIEEGETASEAAEREAWEEGSSRRSFALRFLTLVVAAGLISGGAMHLTHLITLPDSKAHPKSTSAAFIPSTEYSFELFTCSSADVLEAEWLEKDERQRKWVSGWDELEKTIAWGRREETMRLALAEARKRLG